MEKKKQLIKNLAKKALRNSAFYEEMAHVGTPNKTNFVETD